MEQKRREVNLDVINAPSTYKIVFMQKVIFEQARLEKNYDVMRASLQNILDNLVPKAKKENKMKKIEQVRKALKWYDTLLYNKKYIKTNSLGEKRLILPNNIELKVNYAMTYSYEKINELIGDLNII